MDVLLRDALDRLFRAHRLGPAARAAVTGLVESLTDERLQLTEAPAEGGAPDLGPWEDLGRLGQGGMGEVRRVRERGLGRVVAMKILKDEAWLGWFDREARLTASLDHPGVLPVYQYGRLADGRPFFTLREAHGHTLREILDEPQGRELRRLVVALRRAAETLAFAHSRGVVHRDVKPENIVVGEFGEVWVLDWGIAGDAGEAAAGLGSPRYMAPEQLRGEPLGPQVDVWALGAILHELLAGRPAFAGDRDRVLAQLAAGPPRPPGLPAPPELSRLCARAMAARPEDRHPDAGAFAAALDAWLAGTAARAEAEQTLAEAWARMEAVAAARAEAERLGGEARVALAAFPKGSPAEAKAEAWAKEERAEQLAAEADFEEAAAIELARAALERFPGLDAAHALLADHYRRRLEEAEAARDPAAPRLEAALRAHDRGRYRAWLDGSGAVSLVTDPPGRVRARPLVESGRRLIPGEARDLGWSPLRAVELPRGSWLLEVEAEGHLPLRYPVHLGRAEHWDGVAPGEREPRAIQLLRGLGPDEVYVPAGWCRIGGDPLASNGLPAARVWVEPYVVQRFAVTNEQWCAYLNTLVEAGRVEEAFAAVPREKAHVPEEQGPAIYGFDGRFFLKADADGDVWEPRWPVMMISWWQAEAYARWYAESTGRGWRLGQSHEFEKAGRGVDGRVLPWGNRYDPSFACVAAGQAGSPRPAPVGHFATDESVYGVRDLAGTIRSWTADLLPDGRAVARGSYWNAAGNTGRCAMRVLYARFQRTVDTGVRLFRSV